MARCTQIVMDRDFELCTKSFCNALEVDSEGEQCETKPIFPLSCNDYYVVDPDSSYTVLSDQAVRPSTHSCAYFGRQNKQRKCSLPTTLSEDLEYLEWKLQNWVEEDVSLSVTLGIPENPDSKLKLNYDVPGKVVTELLEAVTCRLRKPSSAQCASRINEIMTVLAS